MRKFLLSCLGLVLLFSLQANPIGPSWIRVTELQFESESSYGWVLELEFYNTYPDVLTEIDSICITSSAGKAKIESYEIYYSSETDYMVIRNEDLSSDLQINHQGDYIQVSLHDSDEDDFFYNYTPLVFGDYPESKLRALKEGESYAVIPYSPYGGLFAISVSPNIGGENSVKSMSGSISGKIYDKDRQLLCRPGLIFVDWKGFDLDLHEDGSYTGKSFARNYEVDKLYYDTARYNSIPIEIEPFDFQMEPNGVINDFDVYLLEEMPADMEDINSDESSVFKVFPNPARDGLLNYSVELPVYSANCSLDISDANGRRVAHYPLKQNEGKIDLPLGLTDGLYVVSLYVNNRKYTSSKVLITR